MHTEEHCLRRQRLAYLTAAVFFLVVSVTFGHTKLNGDGVFWDARVYAKAIAAWRAGGDPYAGSSSDLLFVSPPVFLVVGGLLRSIFIGHTGWYVYLVVLVAAMVSVPYVLSRVYIRSAWMTPAVAMMLFALQPRFIVEQSMNSGNIVIPLYALALLAGAAGIRRNRWFWFYVVVVTGSLIKPPFLAMLLVPLLAGGKQYLKSAITTITVLAIYGIQQLALRELYKKFGQAIYRQVIVKHDFGYGTYDWLSSASGRLPALRSMAVLSLLHIAIMGFVVGSLFFLRRLQKHPSVAPLWVPTLLVAAIVSNPRLQGYDACIAILPALYIYMETFTSARQNYSGMAMAALGFNLLLVFFTTSYGIGLNVLLFGSIALTVMQVLQVGRQVGSGDEEGRGTGIPL